jgi:serine-protein kinase ATM
MSTRMILLRLAAAKEQRDQIGAMTSPLAQQLSLVEERCLLRLSSAARKAQNYQIALNAVTRAKKLNTMSHVNASVEFSNVLWGLEEQKTAIQSLKGIVLAGSENLEDGSEEKASLLARLVNSANLLPTHFR